MLADEKFGKLFKRSSVIVAKQPVKVKKSAAFPPAAGKNARGTLLTCGNHV